jgi:hypothetical protein
MNVKEIAMDTKFCYDCKHLKSRFHLYCHHPKNVRVDLVTGDLRAKIQIKDLRTGLSEDYCGENAIWFEPKEPKPAPLPWYINMFKNM